MREKVHHFVKVTREDIRKGRRHSGSSCPIAIAVRRIKKRPKGAVFVDVHGIEITKRGREGEYYILPEEARNFARSFDFGKKVKPFKFSVWW